MRSVLSGAFDRKRQQMTGSCARVGQEEARAEEAERKRLALLPKPKKDVSAFGVKELNLSRAEMRAIEMWIVHDR